MRRVNNVSTKTDLPKNGESSENDIKDEHQKRKGVEGLINVRNPNRTLNKPENVAESEEPKPILKSWEWADLRKDRARVYYHKLQAQGKTYQAKADLARLEIVKQQREEAAKKREAEKQEKEAAKRREAEKQEKEALNQTKTAETKKVFGKK